MANPLDWLLQSVAPPPSPIKYDDGQPSLTAYYPKPSERFEGWVHELLGGGPSASLAHENFARGVPKLLEMTPLGIGLSAADLVRAKWDNDPMGAAAAAIGMLPGAGRAAPEMKAGAKVVKDQADIAMEAIMEALHGKAPPIPTAKAPANDPTAATLKAIEEILGPTPVHAPGPGTPYLMGGPANPANTMTKPNPIAASQVDLLNKMHEEQNWDKYFELQNAALQKMTPKGQVTHAYNPVTGMWEVFDPHGPANAFVMSQHPSMAEAASAAAKLNTKSVPAGWEPMPQQTAMSADWLHPDDFKFENGQWLQKVGLPATKKAGQIPETANPFDYKMNKFGNWDVFHTGTGEIHNVTQSEGWAKKDVANFGKMLAENPDFKGPVWQGTKVQPAAKPIYDYEKDDNGLWHIFDAVSGKTVKVVDTHKQAKDWVANPTLQAPTALKEQFIDLPGNKAPSIPAHPPWLDQSAVLSEDAREAARLTGGYTTPAWRGIRVEPGKDVGTVFQGDEMFSSANPKLADMYASSLGKHPGTNPDQHSYLEGASGMPFWINTNDYHVADAKGAMWSDFNWKAIKEAKDAGKKGVVIHNVWDEPHSTRNLGAPNTIYITFPEGLSTVKSKFAGQFNPNSKDIAKSILATLGVGSTAYPFLQQDNR